ncbi:hypothetical protein N665_0104s0261 [Sinapis alba]|nr:hypothetical protein N665_0104s0261 [Sinapis alba]
MKPVQNDNARTGKSLQAMKADEIPTDNLSSKEEVVGRSNAADHLESLKQSLATINLADLTQDELRDLRNKLLKFQEKLAQKKAEVLRGT